jgi:3-oxoacid CoA-transferase subunit A
MSILFSGDFHANAASELNTITRQSLVEKYQQEKFDKIKYHIILGDCGFLWPGNGKKDISNYDVLARRPFPILGVIGNHEPVLGIINEIPETDIGIGETVYQIQKKPFVAYLKRGKVYTIDGIRFLVLGGALSIDKIYRRPNKSWWELEYWTEQEKEDVFKLLETENTFDYVLSHTGPDHINKKIFASQMILAAKFNDKVAALNDTVHERIHFREWWCGHWHQDVYHYDPETKRGYQYLYRTTKILDKRNDGITAINEWE